MDGNGISKSTIKILLSSVFSLSFLLIFILFVAVLFVLGLFESSSGTGSNISYESECNFEETKVIVMDASNTVVLATVSLEDYVIGVSCPEIGACDGASATLNEQYVKTQYIAAKTYSLARGNYNSSNKSITVRASTRDQQWCDLETGCILTREAETIYHNTYPGNYPTKDVIGTIYMRRSFTEEDLAIFHKYYQDIYGELFLSDSYNGTITALGGNDATEFKATTQSYWKKQAETGKTYDEILYLTGGSGVSDAEDYQGKSIYKVGTYCKSTNPSSSGTASVNYVKWMIDFAADDSHGYSMNNRTMNPDVDCSSFVYYALLNNGYTSLQLGGSYPFSTSSMPSILTSIGFQQIAFDVNSLQEGDILWYPAGFQNHKYGHTEVYIGDGKSVGAHSNYDGKTGDSSGNEVSVVSVREYKSIFRKK